jgi:hypothetical protein
VPHRAAALLLTVFVDRSTVAAVDVHELPTHSTVAGSGPAPYCRDEAANRAAIARPLFEGGFLRGPAVLALLPPKLVLSLHDVVEDANGHDWLGDDHDAPRDMA